MEHRQIIQDLGGYREVAREFRVCPTVAWHWQRRGIPARRWPTIVALAERKGLPITLDTLAARFAVKE